MAAGVLTRRVGRPETALSIPRSAGILVGVRLEPSAIRVVTTTLAGAVLDGCPLALETEVGP